MLRSRLANDTILADLHLGLAKAITPRRTAGTGHGVGYQRAACSSLCPPKRAEDLRGKMHAVRNETRSQSIFGELCENRIFVAVHQVRTGITEMRAHERAGIGSRSNCR